MNCLIILLLLCCCRNANGVCGNSDCDKRRRNDSDHYDNKQRQKSDSWNDYSEYSRNDSYNRNETCGCEEN